MKAPDLSTHILDTSIGKTAPNVSVILEKYQKNENKFTFISKSKTDSDGRIKVWKDEKENAIEFIKKEEASDELVTYRLTFETKEYYDNLETKTLYPFVQIVFEIDEKQHYHIPLLLNPFGFSTYRGS
jgi:5-hydroxyisourate hydrolase